MRNLSFPSGLFLLLCFGFSLGAQDSPSSLAPGLAEPYQKEREALASEVSAAVSDLPGRISDAVALIPRHLFAADSHLPFAYQNRSLPLGGGKLLPAPKDLAEIALLLNLSPEDRILVLGNSAGYGAELFAQLGKEVVLMEEDGAERQRMRNLLDSVTSLGPRRNLTLMGTWAPETLTVLEPFDVIFIHGGVKYIPPQVLALTKPESRTAALLRGESGSSMLILIRRTGTDETITVHGDMFFSAISAWR